MTIADQMKALTAALPEKKTGRGRTIREVSLTLKETGKWVVLAGAHPYVELGEWGGDFKGCGATPEDAIASCLRSIQQS